MEVSVDDLTKRRKSSESSQSRRGVAAEDYRDPRIRRGVEVLLYRSRRVLWMNEEMIHERGIR